MKFCMITTFFGAQSFGGDAAYVDRLCRALLRRGHDVTVIHCADAFEAVRGVYPLRSYTPPPGLKRYILRSRLGLLSPLWSHQTGRPGVKYRRILDVLSGTDFDVIHFHNISLIGGPKLLALDGYRGEAVRLMTAHEHWLVCPLSMLWKYDRAVCDHPDCIRCTLRAGRPVQLWRYTAARDDALAHLDTLIFPSQHTLQVHLKRGLQAPMKVLPYFLADDWPPPQPSPTPPPARPYFLAAGRLVKEKGFQTLIPLMKQLPEVDLRIAGTGPYEATLRTLAELRPNVHFLGLLNASALGTAYRHALAVTVPSLFYETFGYVVLEAFCMGTPALVRHLGALPVLIQESGSGFIYETDDELVQAMKRLATDASLRDRLGRLGQAAFRSTWNEETHIERYLALIGEARLRRKANSMTK